MKIAFFESKREEEAFFKTQLKGHELIFFKETLQEALVEVAEYEAVSLFIASTLSDELLEKLPKLRYIQTRSSGYEHLKCASLYKRGMMVSNVSGYAGPAVAEYAFSLLLNATRKTHISLQRSVKGDFNYLDLKGMELFGKRIGILGLGTIGLQMAKIAKGFGMEVLGYSRTKKDIYDEVGISFVSLEEVLKNADIIMIALPLTPTTTHLINKGNAIMIKRDAIMINIARDEIVEPSLYHDMSNRMGSDVCTDVTLTQKEAFLYTPHVAYYTSEGLGRILDISLQNLEQVIAGEVPQNCLKLACEKEYG